MTPVTHYTAIPWRGARRVGHGVAVAFEADEQDFDTYSLHLKRATHRQAIAVLQRRQCGESVMPVGSCFPVVATLLHIDCPLPLSA